MSPAQVAAFNASSGTTVSELSQAIILVLFVIVCVWAVIMFTGKLKSLITLMKGDIDYGKFAFGVIRVLAVIIVILILVH
jgi:hypothetical protein